MARISRGAAGHEGSMYSLLFCMTRRTLYLANATGFFLLLMTLSGCADRPSYVSIQRVMEALEGQESLSQIIEVKNMQKLASYKRDGEFVVEVYFEQHFFFGLSEAAKLTQSALRYPDPNAPAALSSGQQLPLEFVQGILIKKYGHFKKGDLRQRYTELVFHKDVAEWLFLERRKHWKDFDASYFPKE